MADNWGTDFWGAFADVSKARAAQRLFAQQQQGMGAFGNAMTDPGIFLPQAPQGGPPMGGPAPKIQAAAGPIYQGLTQRGLDPMHAAVLAGNWKQESEFNPKAWNPKEGAGGMDQWRGPRLAALKQYAQQTGRDWQDPNVQMDFTTKVEGKGAEAGPWGQFLAAKDPAAANAALKGYIRYGDDSQGTRLANAEAIMKQFGGGQGGAPQGSPQGGAAPQMAGAGQLSWPHIVQAIQAKNPGISPQALAEAVTLFEPLMSQQSAMDWKEQSLRLREQGLQQQEQLALERDRIAQQRADQTGAHQTATETQAAANEAGRNTRAEQKDLHIQKRFDTKQDQLARGLDMRLQDFKERVRHNQATEGNAQAKTKRDSDLRQAKALNDQLHQRVMEMAATSNAVTMPADVKQKMLDDEMARYTKEKAELDSQAGWTPQAAPQRAATPAPAPTATQQSQAAPAPQEGGGVPVLGTIDRWATKNLPGWQASPVLQGGGGGAQPMVLQSPQDLKDAVAKGNLPVGSVYNGYKFKGGDPLDQSNWEKVSG